MIEETYKYLADAYKNIQIFPTDSSDTLKDQWQTVEQKKREREITRLLQEYVTAYGRKAQFQYKTRKTILRALCPTIVILALAFGAAVYILIRNGIGNLEAFAGILSVCVTFAGLLLGSFNMIVKYAFPEDDEKYITEIVKAIQSNDLENKKQNIQASGKVLQDRSDP